MCPSEKEKKKEKNTEQKIEDDNSYHFYTAVTQLCNLEIQK